MVQKWGPQLARPVLVAMVVYLSLAAVQAANGCGFHDPSSAIARRGTLNLSYPRSLYVQGAVAVALRSGFLSRAHVTGTQENSAFAFHRTVAHLGTLADRIATRSGADGAAYSVLLIGPMLWTTVAPSPEGPQVRTHAEGRLDTAGVVITDGIVVAALLNDEISARDAIERSLVRIYGTLDQVADLRRRLISAFPGPPFAPNDDSGRSRK